MKAVLTLRNYRCFVRPATIVVQQGFTAFVGVNNAGKSTLMRFLLEFRRLFDRLRVADNLARSVTRDSYGGALHVFDQDEIFSNLNYDPITIIFSFESEKDENNSFRTCTIEISVNRDSSYRSHITIDDKLFSEKEKASVNNNILCQASLSLDQAPILSFFKSISNSLYIGPFRSALNVGSPSNYLDISIGKQFIEKFRNLKTGVSKTDNEKISMLTDRIRTIFGFGTLDIAPSADDTSLHIAIDNRPFKQHELGSGLAQFIVVLANAAIKAPDWILIDEPELNLHPSLQLNFLTTLALYANCGVCFSTYSLGLARGAADRIYSVVKEGEGDSRVQELEGTPRLSEFLGEMSFSGQKDLGFEKIFLWRAPLTLKSYSSSLEESTKITRYYFCLYTGTCHIPMNSTRFCASRRMFRY